MTSVRTVVGLLVCIAFAVLAHFAIDMHTDSAPRGLRRNVLVPVATKATSFEVGRFGEPVTRLRNDGVWKIMSPYPAVAEQSAVLRLADALAFAPIVAEMTDVELLRLGRTRRDFGLEAPRITVAVGAASAGADGTVVTFGSATPAGDGVYAAVGEDATVYVVSSNVYAAADLDAVGFRRRRVFGLGQEGVRSFDIRRGDGRFSRLVREGESWKLVEPYESAASSAHVRKFLDALLDMEARDFVWPVGVSNETNVASVSLLAGYGLDPEAALTVTLKCRDGKDRMVSFGKEHGNGLVYALVQDGSSIVTVPMAVRDAAVADTAFFADARLFPLDASAVGKISLETGGTALLLSRGADGAWRLDAPVSAAADQEAVAALVARMLSLQSSDVVADGVRVSVGKEVEPVSVSEKALFAGMNVADLRAKEILRLEPAQVKRVVVADAGKKPVACLFDAERQAWSVEEDAGIAAGVDGAALAKLVAALHPLRAIRVVRLKVSVSELGNFGLDKPVRTVAIDQTAEGSVRRNILLGDVTDGGRFATLGSSDAVFVISSESAAALLAPIAK